MLSLWQHEKRPEPCLSVGFKLSAEAKEQLKSSDDRFVAENDPIRKSEAGKELIRAIFGTDAIAEGLI